MSFHQYRNPFHKSSLTSSMQIVVKHYIVDWAGTVNNKNLQWIGSMCTNVPLVPYHNSFLDGAILDLHTNTKQALLYLCFSN